MAEDHPMQEPTLSDDEEDYVTTNFPVHDAAEAGDVAKLRALLGLDGGAAEGDDDEDDDEEHGGGEDDDDDDSDDDDDDDFDPTQQDSVSVNDRDPDSCTPLHLALLGGHLEAATLLLGKEADPGMRCNGSPPLHVAVASGAMPGREPFAEAALGALLDAGADAAGKDDVGRSALHVAAGLGLSACVALLLARGPAEAAGAQDRRGGTPLTAAAAGGHADVVRALLAAGADRLLRTPEGDSAGHLAAARGFSAAAAALLGGGDGAAEAARALEDKHGRTPAARAEAAGFGELAAWLAAGGAAAEAPPAASAGAPKPTLVITHDQCLRHYTAPSVARGAPEPPPENVRRLHVLLDEDTGILRTREFAGLQWDREAPAVAMSDVLRVHDYQYVHVLRTMCEGLPEPHEAVGLIDSDTAVSRGSFDAALRAAGAACAAVDKVMAGEARNAFCAIRPPGHHAGPRGLVTCENDPDGSHGFCLLNNVAIAGAYARHVYRGRGVERVAIVDFDVHHGNGTESIVEHVEPQRVQTHVKTPFSQGVFESHSYHPWLDESDPDAIRFFSIHGFGLKDPTGETPGWFYPASGESTECEAGEDPGMIMNVGVPLLEQTMPGVKRDRRMLWRHLMRERVLPRVAAFKPDLILISAGFDAHAKDILNWGYVGIVEEDYEWATAELVKIAAGCCQGRVVSLLEGGYRVQGKLVSAFARSVAAHVRGLQRTPDEVWSAADSDRQQAIENEVGEQIEARRAAALEARIAAAQAAQASSSSSSSSSSAEAAPGSSAEAAAGEAAPGEARPAPVAAAEEEDDGGRRKRRRKTVDYQALNEQLKKEEASG